MSIVDDLKTELRSHGATDFRVVSGGKHNRLYWTFNGEEMHHIVSRSDKDINQRLMLSLQDVRRMIGVNKGSGPGERRRKRTPSIETKPTSIPLTITVKPDPLEILAPLKARMERQMEQTRNAPYGVSSFSLLASEIVNCTPEMAKKINKNCLFERQRPMSATHVQRLASEMKRGWFLAGTPVFFCILPGDKQILVNGQHTIEAIATSGVTIPLTFIRQGVASLEEAAKAYACFDIQRSRTWMQAAQAQGLGDKIPMLSAALPAMSWIMRGFRDAHDMSAGTLQSRQARFDAIKDYQGPLMSIWTMLNETPILNQRSIKRAAVFAVAMVTTKAQPSMGEEFWGGMAKDDGLRVGDPRRTLLKYLQNNTVREAARDMLLATALAWNAFFENRSLETCKPRQMKVFQLKGTPWSFTKSVAANKISVPKTKSAASAEETANAS